jgi:hypothetical protein
MKINMPSIASLTSRKVILSAIVLAALAGSLALTTLNQPTHESASASQLAQGRPVYATNSGASLGDVASAPSTGYGGSSNYGSLKSAPRQHRAASRTSNSTTLPAEIIRTGDITVRLKAKSVLGAKQLLEDHIMKGFSGSYIASESVYDHNRYDDLQIEVPVGDFMGMMNRLENRFGKVESESTSSDNVGLRVVNLNAKLANLSAQRIALLKLFDKATNVSDTIKVERVLSGVEGQIEQTQGQISYLNKQVEMSSISVEFQAKNAPHHKKKTTNNPFVKAFGKAGNGIVGVLTGAIIVVGYALPLTAIGFLMYGLILLLIRIWKRRRPVTLPVPTTT